MTIFVKRARFVSRVLKLAHGERDPQQKLHLLTNLSFFLSNNVAGFASHTQIEELIEQLAQELRPDTDLLGDNIPARGSYLHVVTSVASSGGHTAVLQNLITNRARFGEQHTVVALDQDGAVPEQFLAGLPEAERSFIDLSQLSIPEKLAEALRLASKCERMIFYPHMHDAMAALIAAIIRGHRTIYFYNHADHLYWVGSRFCDCLLEMSSDGLAFSKSQRLARDHALLPIPLAQPDIERRSQDQAALSDFRVLTIGDGYRFASTPGEYTYRCFIRSLLAKRPNFTFVIIGFQQAEMWGELWNHPRVIFPGRLGRQELNQYYSGCDLYVDSFPLGGGTATLVALAAGIPALKVKHRFFEFDSLKDASVSVSELEQRVLDIYDGMIPFADNISMHLSSDWNAQFDKIIAGERAVPSEPLGDYAHYYAGLASFQAGQPPIVINRFVKALRLDLLLRYMLLLALYEGQRLAAQIFGTFMRRIKT